MGIPVLQPGFSDRFQTDCHQRKGDTCGKKETSAQPARLKLHTETHNHKQFRIMMPGTGNRQELKGSRSSESLKPMNEPVRGHHGGEKVYKTVQSVSTADEFVCLCVCSTIHPLNAFPALHSSFGPDKSLPTNYIMAAASKHAEQEGTVTQFVTPCSCSQ